MHMLKLFHRAPFWYQCYSYCILMIYNAVDHASLRLFTENTNLCIAGKYINDIVCEAKGMLESLDV